MAHPSFNRNGGHHPNRRHQSAGSYDRHGRGPFNRQRDFQTPASGSQVPFYYHPGPRSQPQPQPVYPVGGNLQSEFTVLYPQGIPESYPMVASQDGSIPKLYTESHLSESFYTAHNKPVKAIFSTNGGKSQPRFITPSNFERYRQLPLWSAEEIQKNANSIRKKFWEYMMDMIQPICWEDMYDYFDCHDIYYHGALNIINLLRHLWHENQDLKKEAHREIALQVGIWCDRWLDRSDNKRKLLGFQDWGNIKTLLNADNDVGDLADSHAGIMRDALLYRQNQLRHTPVPSPTGYPDNQLGVQGARIQHWLCK
ncbi:hypothetical protein CKAH01_17804 [Colletotrichum kahawae]|uniref:Uncharacterized protein n=1 Tax=Colletotrichum kahawae TaxID=34407 RepID=A0AAD9YAD3_COLKA|nr:hypothetical protein CKAH01_17804 [Colletotrichum kahawae]